MFNAFFFFFKGRGRRRRKGICLKIGQSANLNTFRAMKYKQQATPSANNGGRGRAPCQAGLVLVMKKVAAAAAKSLQL